MSKSTTKTLSGDRSHPNLSAEQPPGRTRSVHIEVADNGYIVRISDSSFKEVELVFTNQSSMLRTVKEATTMHQVEEEE